jgi:hypothetical protein
MSGITMGRRCALRTTRQALWAVLGCTVAMVCAACGSSANDGDDGGGGPADGGGGGGGGAGGGTSEWTPVALRDDMSDASHTVFHSGADLVSGIYFTTQDKGWIVTQGDNDSFADGGAVFAATQHAVTSILFSGNGTGLSLLGSIDFTGITPTPTGYIAMAYANDVISSSDGGATFHIQTNGGDQLGIEPVLGYSVTAAGTMMVNDDGVVTTAPSAPGPDAVYTTLLSPTSDPSVPEDPPCELGPHGGAPATRDHVSMSPNGNFIAYTLNPDTTPEVCISHDRGHTFAPVTLPVPPGDETAEPTGVLFTSDTTGIVWYGSRLDTDPSYIQRTIDGGATWTSIALPAAVASAELELHGAFFAPDGMHGWITGYNLTTGSALLLATADGGASWTTVGAGLGAAVTAAVATSCTAGSRSMPPTSGLAARAAWCWRTDSASRARILSTGGEVRLASMPGLVANRELPRKYTCARIGNIVRRTDVTTRVRWMGWC